MTFLMQLQDVEATGYLTPFSVVFRAGEIVRLVGPNGAGKSTLPTRIAGLSEDLDMVHFNGRRLDEWSATELVYRRGHLCRRQTPPFAMPVRHYLTLHMQQRGDSARLSDIVAGLGLDNKPDRQVNQLSGGEWQRVRLAAMILQIDPLSHPMDQLLLLDEPMNSLDVVQQVTLDRLLRELGATGVTVVMNSHDLGHTLRHAGQSWLPYQGKATACGETVEVLNEESLTATYVISFQCVEVAGHIMLVASQQHVVILSLY